MTASWTVSHQCPFDSCAPTHVSGLVSRASLCCALRVARSREKSRRSRERSSLALLGRHRCRLLLAEIPKGVDRNSELKQGLQLWGSGQISVLIGKVLGQQNSGPPPRTARKTQPQTDEQRGKRSCALTARQSISKAMKGLVGGSAQGSADCRRNPGHPFRQTVSRILGKLHSPVKTMTVARATKSDRTFIFCLLTMTSHPITQHLVTCTVCWETRLSSMWTCWWTRAHPSTTR